MSAPKRGPGRPRKAEAAAPAPEPAKDTKKKAFPLISRRDLSTLLEQCLIYQSRVSTAAGSMGELVREYATKKHLHRGAFSDIKKLVRMGHKDPGKLWLFLAHWDDMRIKSGLDKLAQEQGQLLPAITEDATGLVAEPPPAPKTAENVVTYPQPRPVEEQAGEPPQRQREPERESENPETDPMRREMPDVFNEQHPHAAE